MTTLKIGRYTVSSNGNFAQAAWNQDSAIYIRALSLIEVEKLISGTSEKVTGRVGLLNVYTYTTPEEQLGMQVDYLDQLVGESETK